MKKFFTLLLLVTIVINLEAQTTSQAIPVVMPYGKIDIADLELKSCDFEKDANAEVLFNVGKFYYGADLKSMVNEVHKRIKIFNDNGKKAANVHLSYYSGNHAEYISGIEAETINMVDGKPEITKLDKKSIFTNVIDKDKSEITFAFPDVKPGCIIEYRYKWNANYNASIPYWYFQEGIPVRYCEFSTSIPEIFYFRTQPHISQSLVKQSSKTEASVLQVTTHNVKMGATLQSDLQAETLPYNVENNVRGMANIPSLREDAYMSSFADNVQYLGLQLVSVKPIGGFNTALTDTWAKVAGNLIEDNDFGGQLKKKLNNEGDIVTKCSALKTDEEKIVYVFKEVKDAMKWNGSDRWYTNVGTSVAWENKTGNSAEINLILYHLLKKCGVNAYPMVVSTRENGKVDPYYTSLIQFNRAVVYIPVNDNKYYILDATSKYNTYNYTPAELLNSSGFFVDKSKNTYDTVFLKATSPVRRVILINAEIKPGGVLQGSAQISNSGYDKIDVVKQYKTDGEKKYSGYLCNEDNNLKISSLKLENMEVDSLPLTQNISFEQDLTGSGENYIYLNPNVFSSLNKNPFVSENRLSDIYFGYCKNYSINSVYKLPPGYKIDALPKNVNIVLPDKSISFKRMVAEQDGSVLVHFIIDYKRSSFKSDEYPQIRDFYKKMYEMLNEQIVLKKS